MERRRFLRFVAAAPAALALGLGCSGRRTKTGKRGALAKAGLGPRRCRVLPRRAGPGRVLDARQWAALEAAAERIYPGDERGAGALSAGVINYIDAQLTRPPVKSFAPLVKIGAAHLDRLARLEGKAYRHLSPGRQDAILKRVQGGRLGRYHGARFVRILLALTLEGMFSDPIYGGNQDRVGWKSIGFVPQLPAPRCPWDGVGDLVAATPPGAPARGGA